LKVLIRMEILIRGIRNQQITTYARVEPIPSLINTLFNNSLKKRAVDRRQCTYIQPKHLKTDAVFQLPPVADLTVKQCAIHYRFYGCESTFETGTDIYILKPVFRGLPEDSYSVELYPEDPNRDLESPCYFTYICHR